MKNVIVGDTTLFRFTPDDIPEVTGITIKKSDLDEPCASNCAINN